MLLLLDCCAVAANPTELRRVENFVTVYRRWRRGFVMWGSILVSDVAVRRRWRERMLSSRQFVLLEVGLRDLEGGWV